MASRGSVIPVLIEQIKNKDTTVTDGSMTRFMMSLGDVNYFTFNNAKQGELL